MTRLLPPTTITIPTTTTTTTTTTATATATTTIPTIGILQVKQNGRWGTICDDKFGKKEAEVR